MKALIRGGVALGDARLEMVASRREELFVCFGNHAETPDGPLFLVHDVVRAPEAEITRSFDGLSWSPRLTREWTDRAEAEGMGYVIMHAHQSAGIVCLSGTDDKTLRRMHEHFDSHLPTNLCGYIVVGERTVAGELTLGAVRYQLGEFRVVSTPLQRWGPQLSEEASVSKTMARQVAAITEGGQRRLQRARVGLIGVGGAGSTVGDQLGHMSIGRLTLCEADVVEEVNLSRQTGAGPSNVGARKIDVMAAAIRHANPSVQLDLIYEAFPGPDSWLRLRNVDVLVACVDSAQARHEVNKFARRFLLPVVSVGATIRHADEELRSIDGHVARIVPDGACLECEGLTSPLLREREASERAKKYGVGGAPQVMSVNGVLASLATTEVLRLICGLTEDRLSCHWRYDALVGEVYPRAPVDAGCDVCELRGLGTGNPRPR